MKRIPTWMINNYISKHGTKEHFLSRPTKMIHQHKKKIFYPTIEYTGHVFEN